MIEDETIDGIADEITTTFNYESWHVERHEARFVRSLRILSESGAVFIVTITEEDYD